ncbi:hypothetical protein FACS189472_17440 [Alphaproteobacteria bacterium]|nr:hypothetical protein FACS189472_17440 [Alphaproteobacteria bacterium]
MINKERILKRMHLRYEDKSNDNTVAQSKRLKERGNDKQRENP